MDIATLSTVITALEEQVTKCQDMLRWCIEERDHTGEDVWANCLVQAKHSQKVIETMLENEIAYREAA